ncbi:hypothetical protein HDU98_005958, partial [Podochytrium sp. JEL0797]
SISAAVTPSYVASTASVASRAFPPVPARTSSGLTKSVGFNNEPIVHVAPPEPLVEPLIDFSSEVVWDSLPVKIPASPVNTIPASSLGATVQWWQVPVDETWVVDEGDATNPFFGSGRL